MELINQYNIMKYKNQLWHIKALILEECAPLSILIVIYMFVLLSPFIPFVIIYSSLKSKVSLIIWLGYFLWSWYDLRIVKTKGRKTEMMVKLLSHECIRNYFPLRLIKTHDLTPSRNYIFATFPHGILPIGTSFNMFTDVSNFYQLFPNIDVRVATLGFSFITPFTREFFTSIGFCSSDKANIKYLLNSKPSKAILLFPGGVKECSISHPGNEYKIVKKHRKGFVKIALETGTCLVPVFSFGEQNSLDQENYSSPILQFIIKLIYKFTRLKFRKIKGREIFQQSFSLLPHRRAITTVGKPIIVPKVDNPSQELIDEFHEKFYQALYNLFEENKAECDEAGSAAKLTMV